MSITLRVLTGARAGHEQVLDKSLIVAGRHPLCDLRFDAERDRDVSTRHAELRAVDENWVLRDMGSTNGTYLNGEHLAAERVLSVGDTIGFGEFGPRVSVVALAPHDVASGTAVRSPSPQRVPAAAPAEAAAYDRVRRTIPSHERPAERGHAERGPAASGGRRQTTGERVAQAVRESTQGLRRLVAGAFILLLVVVGAAFWATRRGDAARRAEIDALVRRNDSLTAAFEREMTRVTGTMAGLDSALAAARSEGDALRTRLGRARSSDEIAAVTAQLERVQSKRARLLSVRQLDNTAIAAANGPAIALLAVQMSDGRSYTGTAFGVTRDGLLVTNRHLLRDPASGDEARQMLAKFSGSRQWLPVRLVRIVEGDDLAFVQVEARGPWPAVSGVAREAAPVGAPTVVLGFPLGTETAMEGRGGDDFVASATLATATVSKVLPDVLQLDAYAGEGSSGSPVFDGAGRVVGVVYGGARESGGRIVYAVPAARLLAALPPGASR